MIREKYCSRCKRTGVKLMKYAKPRNIQYYLCRECNSRKQKKYFLTVNGKRVVSNAQRASYAKYPQKQIARVRVYQAIKAGKLLKEPLCQECGDAGRIEGHHMDYLRPLEVVWLCSGCHADYHKIV